MVLRFCVFTLLCVAPTCFTYAVERPNILFCLADDWGWPHAGAYGDRVVATPAFDRLAREGVLFDHAYVSSPSCTPCRSSILTGQQFYRLGEGANLWSTLDIKHPNFMFLLRDAGYEIGHWRKAWGPGTWTASGYKEHPAGKEYGQKKGATLSGFEVFMKERNKSKPFCFWFGTSDPHRGYKKGTGQQSGIPVDQVRPPSFYPNSPEIKNDIADYYYEVQRWDSDVSKAIALLEQKGLLDNTIVVMTGDHGMPFPRCKGNLYDWGTRVPLAIRWGRNVKVGRTVNSFTSLTDLAPTFLEVVGLNIPEQMTGRSLVSLMQNPNSENVDPKRSFIVTGRERHTPAQAFPSMSGYPSRGIRTDKWLLILNHEPQLWPAGVPQGSTHKADQFSDCDGGPTRTFLLKNKDSRFYDLCFGKRPAVELYDNRADPDQINNLAENPEYSKTVNVLRDKLIAYLKETNDPRQSGEPITFYNFPYRGPRLKQSVKNGSNGK